MSKLPAVQTFQYHLQDVRIIDQDGAPWFVESDVKAVLGFKPGYRVGNLLDSEKGKYNLPTIKGLQSLNIINESGLYKLIMRSSKAEAEPFQTWVTGTVLPTIRKTGTYKQTPLADPTPIPSALESALLTIAQGTQALMGKAQEHEEVIKELSQGFVSMRQDIDELKSQRELGTGYVRIIGYANLKKRRCSVLQAQAIARYAVRYCKDHGLDISSVPDETYGKVNIYPMEALDAVWPIVMGNP
jgi:prophage antirepressor-like protein